MRNNSQIPAKMAPYRRCSGADSLSRAGLSSTSLTPTTLGPANNCSDACRVSAETPCRASREERKPGQGVGNPPPLHRGARQRRVRELAQTVHRGEAGDLLERRPLVQRHEQATEEGQRSEARTDQLHDVLAREEVPHEQPERREDQ